MDINLDTIRAQLTLGQGVQGVINGFNNIFNGNAQPNSQEWLQEQVQGSIEQQLPQSLQGQPYSDQLVQGISDHLLESGRISDPNYTQEQLEIDITSIGMNVIANHIETLPPEERFEAMQNLQPVAAEILPADQASNFSDFFARLESAPEGLQESFIHAYGNNAEFREYIVENGMQAGADGSTFVQDLFEGLQQKHPESGKPLFRDADGNATTTEAAGHTPIYDQIRVGAVQDILTTIGNNPDYDMTHLDRIETALERVEAAEALEGPDGAEAQRLAQLGLINVIRDAGGNLPALSALDADPSILWNLFSNILDPNISPDRAMNMFASDLGLEVGSEQYEALMNQFGPLAEILEFMLEPYAELIQEHGPRLQGYIQQVGYDADTLFGGRRVERTGETPDPNRAYTQAASPAQAVENGIAHDRGTALPETAPTP